MTDTASGANTTGDQGAVSAGTKIRTLYEYPATGVVVKPRAANLPMPRPDWFLVQFDDGRGRLCVHRDMLAIANG